MNGSVLFLLRKNCKTIKEVLQWVFSSSTIPLYAGEDVYLTLKKAEKGINEWKAALVEASGQQKLQQKLQQQLQQQQRQQQQQQQQQQQTA
ncbi:uncharacterized protein EMH_0024330 [Eimeria mitis]|uniref:Uncharacterized protein n=1 Tax=Eimeria mitis TaxID=44415 RepID=U6KB48_9EIME|nr:uncharacterized protein EMH_0024330 [Eimeria mitis]CDJ35179.1 hypothetical protein EMH_0024330 [Eimeria mitis]